MKTSIILLAILILMSCDRQQRGDIGSAPEAKQANLMVDKTALDEMPDVARAPAIERMLIRTGNLTFEATDIRKTKTDIELIVKDLSGYINSESQNNYGDRIQYSQVIRVPAAQFDALVSKVEALAVKIESKSVNTDDVTEEFIDVEARMKTKKELEERYREILKQAKTVADILSIESQIGSVRAEIESMEGRLKYLRSQVSFSTLNVSFYEVVGTNFGFASKFARSLGDGWDNMLTFIIALANLWPFILAGGVAVFIWRRRKKKTVQV